MAVYIQPHLRFSMERLLTQTIYKSMIFYWRKNDEKRRSNAIRQVEGTNTIL